MRNKVDYEWDYETVIEGEIMDHDQRDNLSEYTPNDVTDTLVLVRQEGNEDSGMDDMVWAYVKNGKLPTHFVDALGYQLPISVPKRFQKELDNHLKTLIPS